MPSIETCISPILLPAHTLEGKAVVVTDIFRATSCMVAGIGAGIQEIVPVPAPEACSPFMEKGYLRAGEQNGIKVAGFDLGNSPFEFMEAAKQSAKIVMSTTNGTKAIHAAQAAEHVLIGAFLNLGATAQAVAALNLPLVILCAGWKNRFSLEDTLFAGALSQLLHQLGFTTEDDATLAAQHLFEKASEDLRQYLMGSSHAHRLKKLGIEKDLGYCAQTDLFEVVPTWEHGKVQAAH